MKIIAKEIDKGHRFQTESGFLYVDITSDGQFFTIYDNSGAPCGTITRPRVIGANQKWSSYLTNGDACTTKAIGPRTAFKLFVYRYCVETA